MGNLGFTEIMLIMVVVLLLFGAKRLPEVGSSIGKGIREFRTDRVFMGIRALDPGWDGRLTLELSNVANLPIVLTPGMKIGQVGFMQMTTPADRPYGSGASGSKYQGQRGPTPSRYFENFAR